MNSSVQHKQKKKIKDLLEKPYESLSVQEKLEMAYDKLSKYPRTEKVTYDEFVLILLNGGELDFGFQGKGYEICYGLNKGISFFYDTKYIDGNCIWSREENYANATELLEQVRVDGKTIREIWDEVTC